MDFYLNSLKATNSTVLNSFWSEGYKYIYYANNLLQGIGNSANLLDSTKSQLDGEAKFIRAFCYFYLVNLFGDVPLILTTAYQSNSTAYRTSKIEVYKQIVTDLRDAQRELKDDYSISNNERTRPNKWAATALLARVFLFTGDWTNAEVEATSVINNSSTYSLLTDINESFLKNSQEAIWQLMPVIANQNTSEGVNFILTSTPNSVAISNSLLGAFEPGDIRKSNWIDSITTSGQTYYYPFKYKVKTASELTEYSMVLRLAEQYLIRAEARAQLNKISEAQVDLNIIRNRANLPNTSASDKASLLLAIEHERQVELFSEWGHRWFDLKRLNRADAVLLVIKGSNWQSTDTLYPIPQMEISNDPNLTQNLGY
jgi:hypothetical protein